MTRQEKDALSSFGRSLAQMLLEEKEELALITQFKGRNNHEQ